MFNKLIHKSSFCLPTIRQVAINEFYSVKETKAKSRFIVACCNVIDPHLTLFILGTGLIKVHR